MSLNFIRDNNTSAKKLLCLEVNPPRGVDLEPIFARLDGNVEGIDFLNVTDSALAKMRMGALSFAALLKHRYNIEPLVNLSCRDRNVIALQSDLLAGWASGIRSIIALTGDAVSIGDMPDAKGVFEVNSVGLLHLVQALNEGKDLAGNKLTGIPNYLTGVVVNPNAKNASAEIRRLSKKREAGACYALSQPVFDEESSQNFFREASAIGIPIFVGLLPFKSGQSLLSITRIPGIRISERLTVMASTDSGSDLSEFSIEHSVKIAQSCAPYVRGYHVISGATPKLALQLIHRLKEIL